MAMAPSTSANSIIPSLQPPPPPPPPPSTPQTTPSPILRNPLPLSAKQEAEVRDIYYKKVRSRCTAEIAQFAACAKGRTVTLAWACKDEQRRMNSCMIAYSGREAEDEAREEWFRGIEERRRKKVLDLKETEERRKVVVDLTRRQEEKERVEMEVRRREKERDVEMEMEGKGKKGGGWWR